MACQVNRNENGDITRVNDSLGRESRLFKKIAKHPLIKDTEQALSIYKNIYVDKVKNVAAKTQTFFGDVVSGNSSKYIPATSYRYELPFTDEQESFRKVYDTFKGNFDEHIATSIPTFRDIQVKKGNAIKELLDEGGLVYDLGGSEGGFVKTITKMSEGAISSINLDPNTEMQKAHNASPVQGSEFIAEAFQEGFDDVVAHEPEAKADVVHESMLFQFINNERASKIQEVKDSYLKEDGLFITEQKFKLGDPALEQRNEVLKNTLHKSKYYTKEQVRSKGEDVLVGMDKNQANFDEYVAELEESFKFVQVYWTAGNFRGIVATDSKQALTKFMKNLGDTSNTYTASSDNYSTEAQLKEHNLAGGSTFTLDGNNKAGSAAASVSVFPERSVVLDREITKEDLDKFEKDNQDIIKGNKDIVAIGTWFDKSSGKTYIDISTVLPKSDATILGRKYNQKAVYDLETRQEIPTGGNGQVVDNMGTEKERIRDIRNILTEDVTEEIVEDSLDFVHRTKSGSIFSDYAEALQNAVEGEAIEVGFITQFGDFTPIVNVSKNTNKKTEDGFLNHHIENNVIASEKVSANGGYVLSGYGKDDVTRAVNTEIVIDDAYAYLGTEGVVRLNSEKFTLQKTNDKLKLTKPDGSVQYVSKRELNDMSYPELQKKYPNIAMDVVIGREYAISKPSHKTVTVENESQVTRSESELQLALLNLLNKMGVKVTSISNYVANYKTKNRVNPSARALADIANQVVAIGEGNINIDELTEEAAHFINEAMPQEQVVNLLRNIHKTEEWKQFSEVYRRIYGQEYAGEELEQAVRREILGKVIANSIKSNFSKTNKTETQGNIIDNVVGLITDFINTIKTFFRSDFRTELEEYKKNVNDLLLREDITDIINTDQFKDNKFRLYSVTPNTSETNKIFVAATKAVRALEIQVKNSLGKENINKIKLEEINKQLEAAQEKEAISGITSMAEGYIKILNAAIKESQNKGNTYLFTNEENVIYKALTDNLNPAIAELNVIVKDSKNKDGQYDYLIERMEQIGKDVTTMKARASVADKDAINKLIDRIIERHNLGDESRAYIEKWIDNAEKDTNYFHSTFGQLLHSRDGLLNLAGTLITDMSNEANWEFMAEAKAFQNKIKKLGFKESDLKQFVDKSGKYIISKVDNEAFDKRLDEIYVEAYKFATGSTMDAEEIIKKRNNRTIPELTPAQQTAFRQEERKLLNPEIERRFISQYYDDYEARLTDNNISEPTQKFLSGYYAELSDLKKKATTTVNGKQIVDYALLSEADLEKLQQINANRKAYKSYTNDIGELKDGLEYRTENGLLFLDDNNQPEIIVSENASDNARIAVDLNRLDAISREEFAKKEGTQDDAQTLPDAFVDMLNEIDQKQGREAAIKFLNVNAYMGFSSDFWNGLGGGESFIAKLRAAKETNPAEADTIDKYIEDIVKTNAKMRGILKVYSSKNNPAEIQAERMQQYTMDSIKELQENLSTLYMSASKFVKKEEGETTVIPEATGVSSANDAYLTALEEEDANASSTDNEEVQRAKLKKEFAFATQHMTNDNRKALERNIDIVDAYLRGDRMTVPARVEQILEELGYDVTDISDIDVYAVTIQTLIRDRVLPYYKKFAPEGHAEYMEAVAGSEGLLGDTLRNTVSPYLEISPNYSFFDEVEDANRNPKFEDDYQGGYLQANLDKFGSTEFDEMFGTIVDGKSTKNEDLYELYKLTLEYNKNALDNLNMGVGHNNYRLPQVRKNTVQRVKDLTTSLSSDKISSAFQEVFNFTEDDQVSGEAALNSDSVKVIPKRFVNRLEDPNDVSDDLFYSLAALNKEATLRKKRVKYYGDFMSIYDKMLTRNYNGKAPEATQTVKMFKSAMDYNLFGVKETATYPVDTFFGKIDIAKVAKLLLSFIKFRNLGFNLVIPLTSAITGKVFTFNEKLIGEHINSRSIRLGNKELRSIIGEGMSEFGKVNTEAKINVLGQYFRAFDLSDSFENSNYGFLTRFAPRTGMALHTAANYPVYGEIMMGVLHDYRIVEGKLVNSRAFEAAKRNEGLTKDQIKQEWSAAEDKVLYKFLDVADGQLNIDKESMGDLLYDVAGEPMSDQRLDEYIENAMQGVQSFTSNVISNVDGQIPSEMRVSAQRHFLLNFFMTHRGWLSIATSRRFKHRHLNTNSGVEEEGSYNSLWNYIGRYLKEYRASNFKNVIGSFKKAYEGADEVEVNNLKRVGIEMAMINSLMLFGIILANAAEDDDNKELFALQATNYMLFRTLNEMSSVQLGIGNQYVDIIESPFVGLQTVENIFKVAQLLDTEEITRGRYKGMQKNERLLLQLIPGTKQVFDLNNMNDTYDTYKYYNKKNLNYSAVGKMWAEYEESLKEDK